MAGGGSSFGAQLAWLAAHIPDHSALIFPTADGNDIRLTYREFDQRVNAAARLLASAAVDTGSMVAVALSNSVEFYIAVFATWRLGACAAPLRPDATEAERSEILALLAPQIIVGDWRMEGRGSICAETIRTLAPDPRARANRTPQPAWTIASGGSTAKPKLIVNLRAGTLDAHAIKLEAADVVRSQDIRLVCAPLYHTHGLMHSLNSLMSGETLVCMKRFVAADVLDAIERYGVTKVGLVPTMLVRLLRALEERPADLSSLKLVLGGAGTIAHEVAKAWIRLVGPEAFVIGYGASEAVGSTRISGSELLERPGSVGRGVSTDIKILSADGVECPPGTVGEIFLRRSDYAGRTFEYRGVPPPQRTFDGFTSVGDLGWLDEAGYLYIADRRTDMVKTGGVNVFTAEVEAALLENPKVLDVAVIGLPDLEWGQRLHAIVVPTDNTHPPTPGELLAHCRERLSATKLPKTIEFVVELPRSESLKLNKSLLVISRTSRDD
jgi:bile acid-coenzyme A ligase